MKKLITYFCVVMIGIVSHSLVAMQKPDERLSLEQSRRSLQPDGNMDERDYDAWRLEQNMLNNPVAAVAVGSCSEAEADRAYQDLDALYNHVFVEQQTLQRWFEYYQGLAKAFPDREDYAAWKNYYEQKLTALDLYLGEYYFPALAALDAIYGRN